MFKVWDHTFEHVLKLDAAARSRTRILLTEPPLNPLSNRRVHYTFLSSTHGSLLGRRNTLGPTAKLDLRSACGAYLSLSSIRQDCAVATHPSPGHRLTCRVLLSRTVRRQRCMACCDDLEDGWPGLRSAWGLAAAQRDRRRRQLHRSRHEAHVLCRQQMVDAMFRRYGFAGVQVQIQAVLTLYSQGGLYGSISIARCRSTRCALRIIRHLDCRRLPHLISDAFLSVCRSHDRAGGGYWRWRHPYHTSHTRLLIPTPHQASIFSIYNRAA